MRSRDDLPVLFGFSSKEERQVFDRLCAISSVGPKVALAVLSSFSPSELAACVASQDVARMTQVPGIGKKTASRLVLELEGLFAPGGELGTLAGAAGGAGSGAAAAASAVSGMAAIEADATTALLGMGFTQREIELALEGMEEAGVTNDAEALTYALKRVGGLR
jgi:Holliday junction DNA helicase RuvA